MTIRWGILGILALLLAPADPALATAAEPQLLRAPLRFEPNRGQTDPQVRFLARGTGYGLFLTDDEAVMRLALPGEGDPEANAAQSAVVRMRLHGAVPARPRGRLREAGRSHYLSLDGRRPDVRDVPYYSELVARGRYPGIDVVHYGNDGQLEYDFVVAPGADPAQIALDFDGADGLSIAANGDLHVAVGGRTLVQRAPVSFQYVDVAVAQTPDATRLRHGGAERIAVASRYAIGADGRVRFELGAYDRARPLVIDPVLVYSTFLGGTHNEIAEGLVVGGSGNVTVVGHTWSTDFPRVGGVQANLAGSNDAFITKFNAAGTAIEYSTYFGTADNDIAYDVALASGGKPWVVGVADDQAFLIRLSFAGDAIEVQRSFGGMFGEAAHGVAIDANGLVYVCGITYSPDFPVLAALDAEFGGNTDGFLRRYSATGALQYSTFIGGANWDKANDCAIGPDLQPVVVGTTSTDPNNPQTSYVLKFNSTGSGLAYNQTFGGSDTDVANTVAVDEVSQAYVAGGTGSPDFPVLNALDSSYAGNGDAFVRKYAANGTLLFSTLQGDGGADWFSDATVAPDGTPHFAGMLGNAIGAVRYAANGNSVALLAYLTSGGNAGGIDVDNTGQVYLAGHTLLSLPVTPGAFDTTYNGGTDAFVMKISPALPQIQLVSASVSVGEGNTGTQQVGLQLTLSQASTVPVSVLWGTADDSATSPADYVFAFGTLEFAAGETSKTLSFTVNGDFLIEGNQRFFVNFAGPVHATMPVTQASVTIVDDDSPGQVHLAGAAYTVGEGQGTVTIAVTRSGGLGAGVSVPYGTVDGSAVAGADYTATGGTLTFGGGETSKTFQVPISDDGLHEDTEAFTASLGNPTSGATLGLANTTVSIIDNDQPPTLSASGCNVVEGHSGTIACAFTATLSAASGRAVTFTSSTADSGATNGVDYQGHSGVARSIPAGQTSLSFAVPVIGDLIDEPNENISMTLANVVNANVGFVTPVGTIQDDDNAPVLSIDNGGCTVTEGDSGSANCNFVARLSAPSSFAVTFNTATANGTATAGSDYAGHASTARSIGAGQTSLTIAVPVLPDLLDEIDENFTLNVSGVNNATPGGFAATGTILDNDPTPTLSVDNGGCTVTEGNSGSVNCNFVARLSAPSSVAVTFNSATANGTATAGADYTGHAGTARSIPAGQTTLTIAVPVLGDTLDEDNETFALNISNVALALPASLSATGTINDDDAAPTVSVDNGGCTVTEGNSGSANCNFVVRLSAASSQAVTFNSVTANGTATAGSDYTGHASTARSIAAGQTSLTIAVPVLGDMLDEDNETFALNLFGIANATPGSLSATGTINDDDAAPTVSIDNGGCSVTEGNAGSVNCNFVVRLSAASSRAVTFNSATANGTATAGSDYTSHASTARSIAAGQTSLTIAVPVLGDTLDEDNETFALNLTGIANATPGSLSAIGTITDDDATPTLSIDNGGCTVTEGNSGSVNCSFVARLSAISGRNVSFTTATANGTATAGSDYTAHGNIARTLSAGNQTLTVLVPVLGDTLDEPNETFALNFTAISNATPGALSGTGTITDDDEPVTPGSLRVRDAALTVGENSGSVQVVVERVGGSSGAASVQYATANGSAIAGLDYGAAGGTLNWTAGDASAKTITLTIIFDPAVEPQESFTLNLSQASGATLGAPAASTITIVDGTQMLHASGFE